MVYSVDNRRKFNFFTCSCTFFLPFSFHFPSRQLHPRRVANIMVVKEGAHVLKKEAGNARLSHYEYVVDGQHGLNERMEPLPEILGRRLNLPLLVCCPG
jgi:hypothetical protein